MNETERRMLEKAYDFLLRVRTELHYLNKRAADVIVLGQQLPIANRLGSSQKKLLAVARLLCATIISTPETASTPPTCSANAGRSSRRTRTKSRASLDSSRNKS